jgi:hypothetical protein
MARLSGLRAKKSPERPSILRAGVPERFSYRPGARKWNPRSVCQMEKSVRVICLALSRRGQEAFTRALKSYTLFCLINFGVGSIFSQGCFYEYGF